MFSCVCRCVCTRASVLIYAFVCTKINIIHNSHGLVYTITQTKIRGLYRPRGVFYGRLNDVLLLDRSVWRKISLILSFSLIRAQYFLHTNSDACMLCMEVNRFHALYVTVLVTSPSKIVCSNSLSAFPLFRNFVFWTSTVHKFLL